MPPVRPALIIALFLTAILVAGCGAVSLRQHPPTQVGLLEDPSGKMDINQAASPQTAGRYQEKQGNRMSLGFSRSALWVRIPLKQTPQAGSWVLEVMAPWMDQVDLYLPRPDGSWSEYSTGLNHPSPAGRMGMFALDAPADTPRQGYAYLRLQSMLSLNAALRIWSQNAFAANSVKKAYLFGILFGIMGAMVLVNFLVLLTTRDRAYLLYVVYLLSIIAHQLCLQGQVLFLPGAVWHLVPQISLMVCGVLFFFAGAFCRVFLDTKLNAPLANKLIIAVQGVAVVLFFLGLTGYIWWGTWVVHLLALLGPVVAILAGFQALAKGFRPARFYLAAWIVLLLGGMSWAAWSMGWRFLAPLPQSQLTIAAALECVLLSLALADRIGMMQQERRILALRERRYHQLSITDSLTGLYNARYFWSKLESEIQHAQEMRQPLSLVLMDVDNFKDFNDNYGHPEGDKVLAELGRLMRTAVRPADTPCRYGGEEFALTLARRAGQGTPARWASACARPWPGASSSPRRANGWW